MKQEILCTDCALCTRNIFKSNEPYVGENLLFRLGLCRRKFVCDQCNAILPRGAMAVGFGIYGDYVEPGDAVGWLYYYLDMEAITDEQRKEYKHCIEPAKVEAVAGQQTFSKDDIPF